MLFLSPSNYPCGSWLGTGRRIGGQLLASTKVYLPLVSLLSAYHQDVLYAPLVCFTSLRLYLSIDDPFLLLLSSFHAALA